jgi:predicted AlkP superfamily phosphohydrolase/phosphomutase
VRSAASYRVPAAHDALDLLPDGCFAQGLVSFGLIRATEHTSASLKARTLWSILGGAGLSAGIVNWPLSSPAQPVRGYLVSDRFYRPADPWLEPDDPASIYPLDLLPAARSAGESVRRSPESGVLLAALPTAGLRQQIAEGQPVLTDRMYEQISRTLDASLRPNLTAVRVRQLDFAGHQFLRYAMPAQFGDVTEEERRRYGTVLEQAYARIDAIVGRALATLGPEDLLLVISGYGMEPMSIGKRLFERAIGDPEPSGTHENAPDGFMLAYGPAVAPGRKKVASVFDVAPTVLYYLGMPAARDMDGYVRTDVFSRDFTDPRPMAFIPTYER